MKVVSAAGLLADDHEGLHSDELYGRAVRSYETLLEVLENGETARRTARIMGASAEEVRAAADSVIRQLLYNDRNDPCLSLGLSRRATQEEIKKRRKRLLVLYHPDKPGDREKHTEMSMRINEAHDQAMQRGPAAHEGPPEHFEKVQQAVAQPQKFRFSHTRRERSSGRYARYVPVGILVAVVLITVLSIGLYIFHRIEKRNAAMTRVNVHSEEYSPAVMLCRWN